jgi:CRP-like cAMP-binding protein
MGGVDASHVSVVRSHLLHQSRLSPGDVLIHPGMTFERLYLVRYGHFKTVLLASEGQTHTAALHSRCDVL